MAVQLGSKGQPDFTQPVALMKNCHRRIEHFLHVLIKVAQEYERHKLDDEGQRALKVALDYFRHAAPSHTADEEQSLFPRMRNSDDAEVIEVMEDLERLENDHRKVEAAHHRIDQLGRHWLDDLKLDPTSHAELTSLLRVLTASYAEHIALEDQRVFVLAEQSLAVESMQAIGREMQCRRSDVTEKSHRQPSELRHAALTGLDLSRFAESVATTPSVPASGCVAALTGALATALTEMIVSLSKANPQNEAASRDRSNVMAQLARNRSLLLMCVDRDAEAFRRFQSTRQDGDSLEAAAGSGINDVPLDVAAHCLATLECLANWVHRTKSYLKAEAYAASVLALVTIDVSRFNLHANAHLMNHHGADCASRQATEIYKRAVRLHSQIAFALNTADALPHRREYQPKEQTHSIRTMHDNVETWDDVCCCEPEPRWQAIAEELARTDPHKDVRM